MSLRVFRKDNQSDDLLFKGIKLPNTCEKEI